jgi:hypothetical protein
LFRGRSTAPFGTEGAACHLGKVKSRKDNPPQLIAAFFLLAFRLQRRIRQNSDNLVNRAADLLRWHAGIGGGRIENCRKTNNYHNHIEHIPHHSFSSLACSSAGTHHCEINYHQRLRRSTNFKKFLNSFVCFYGQSRLVTISIEKSGIFAALTRFYKLCRSSGQITKVTISAWYEVTAGRLSTLIACVDNIVVGFTQLLIILADIRLHRIEFDSFNQLRIFVLDPRPYHCSPKSR